MSTTPAPVPLLYNIRFYILAFSFLLSIMVFAFLRLAIASDQAFPIRLQQTYGLLCVAFWYSALIISPLGYIIGKDRVTRFAFARRAIGVSAFYFALLHGTIALFGQLGGVQELVNLPMIFHWSLAGGTIAFVVLVLLASTSFDTVMRYMTFRKWKWLHRWIYLGGVLALFHLWTIGTHLTQSGVQIAALIALSTLIGLEAYRACHLMGKKWGLSTAETTTLFLTAWAIAITAVLTAASLIDNYHGTHTETHTSSSHHGATR